MIEGTPASSSTAVPIGAPQAGGGEFGQEEGDAEGERYGENDCEHRGDERAVNGHARTEDLLHRIPVGVGEEADAEGAEGRQSADEQQHDDTAEQKQDEATGAADEGRENCVLQARAESEGRSASAGRPAGQRRACGHEIRT